MKVARLIPENRLPQPAATFFILRAIGGIVSCRLKTSVAKDLEDWLPKSW